MMRRYCFILYFFFVSASPLSGSFPFSWFPVQSLLFTLKSLLFTPISRTTWGSTCGTACGARHRRGVPVWIGGVCSLIRCVTWACSLTWYPNPLFRFPVRFLFLQGTGNPSSADHLLVGPSNGDCDASVYPPLYLWKGCFPFLCHESTQLREHE